MSGCQDKDRRSVQKNQCDMNRSTSVHSVSPIPTVLDIYLIGHKL
ncbi:9025_t:CDS:2 [Funneliformis geosporum]|nr:9025_t:CDS:2 [Funneliformis geosporum]